MRSIIVVCCLFCFGVLTNNVMAEEQPKDLDVYLLIGQSNMAGRAPLAEGAQQPIAGAWLYVGSGEWAVARHPLNIHSTIRKPPNKQRHGPGAAFAVAMAEANANRKIGLVVNARGSTRIQHWLPGQKYYQHAMKRAKEAAQVGKVRGILWHQGENDLADTTNYDQKLTTLLAALRKDLGDPNLPVVIGEIYRPTDAKATGEHTINEQLRQVAASDPYTAVAASDGLTTIDWAHFDAASMDVLGQRYAAAMLALQGGEAAPGQD